MAVIPGSLPSSRFEATPITCIHNVKDDVIGGVPYKLFLSTLTAVAKDMTKFQVRFDQRGYTPSPDETTVVRLKDIRSETVTWKRHDVTKASTVTNPKSCLTLESMSFPLVREGFELQPGQKIGW